MKVERKGVSCTGECLFYTQNVNMFCNTNQFPSLPFCVPHTKTHGVRVLSKNYHMQFYPKLGHGTCAI